MALWHDTIECPECEGLGIRTYPPRTCEDCCGLTTVRGFCNECGSTLRPTDSGDNCEECEHDLVGPHFDTALTDWETP